MTTANSGTSRRGFLNALTNLVMVSLGLGVLIPAARYVLAPLWPKQRVEDAGPDFVDVGPLADVPVGEWRLLSLETVREDGWRKTRTRHAVWVRRPGPDNQDVTVFSSICPHLGCPINWHPDQSQFVCPCHGGLFDEAGRRTGGPPPRDMDPLEYEVRAGRLRVRWRDFKIGVGERIPVNV
jgi:Rieske Fe-S protein